MGTRDLLVVAVAGTLLAACAASGQGTAHAASVAPASSPAAAGVAATAPAAPTPVPPTPDAASPPPPAAPAPMPAAPAVQTFGLGGHGSVTVSVNGGSATITAAIFGLAAVAHAVHLHAGCDGRPSAHIAAIGLVGSSGTVSVSVPTRLLGATVIVYPGALASGTPILCGPTA